MKIDISNLDREGARFWVGGCVVPQTIAWVSTVGENGVFNLAPFSAYGGVTTGKPALLGFCVAATTDGQKKDTLRNIEATKEFVINVVDETLAEAMIVTARAYPSDVDEFKEAGLTPVMADLVKVPMVAESPINLECRLVQILEFGEAPFVNSYIIGEVLRVHIKDELYANGEIQKSKIKAIAHFGGGGNLYCRTTDTFEVKRPT